MADDYKIPFNRPCFQGNELAYIAEAIESRHISGNGRFTQKCSRFLEEKLGVPSALLTSSCTDALEMAAILLDLQPGDEVIVPSFTFVSTANAFVLRGAVPVFIDCRPDTLNLDETLIEDLITPRTKAIVPVHYGGVACEMDAILATAAKHGLAVIEDNAHGLFGRYKGKLLGTFGKVATLSFHETKSFISGEGGCLLVNDPETVDRAEIIREKGTNRNRFYRGEVDKYTWVDIGSSFLPSDITAAFLYAQLEAWEPIIEHRRRIWHAYQTGLSEWAAANGVTLATVPEHCDQAYHLFYLLLPTLEDRTRFIAHLDAHSISAVFHYVPLHLSDMGRRFGGKEGDCPVTEDVSDRLVRLPFFNDFTTAEQDEVIAAVQAFRV